MKTDIQIARETPLKNISEIASYYGIDENHLVYYGKNIAKLPLDIIDEEKIAKSNLILMTAMSPTKAGIGKTTVSIGLSMAFNRLGRKSALALREPSMGPCFGMKGGASGGGYSQVLPMEKINLHFTGDMHAITSANNLIAALVDNYIFRHQGKPDQLKTVFWRRVLDMNDRALRHIVTGMGDGNGVVRESGFDITPASEIMAIMCLATDMDDLRKRLENILIGVTCEGKPFYMKDMGGVGSLLVVLMDAIHPNLVQTTEHTGAFIHGGPFANIAHGCNSIIATKMAMSCSEYVVTEAGFGADLGAEKFLDIKCRMAGIKPRLTVLVVTSKGLAEAGLENMARHIENLRNMGQTVVVTLNRFGTDTKETIDEISEYCKGIGVDFAPNEAFLHGGAGCEELAQLCLKTMESNPSSDIKYAYDLDEALDVKVEKIAKNIYRAGRVEFTLKARKAMQKISEWGLDKLPVCIAKTQYSFSDDPKAIGVPEGFTFTVRDFVASAGAGMIVAISGDILRMPGLPLHPQSENIDIVNGEIEGLA